MLSASDFSTRSGQIKASVHIFDWLECVLVWPVLLYRRMRYGYTFRRIRLAQPRNAKVDPADYKRLREYEWFSIKGTRNFYAVRRAGGPKESKLATIYMHHELIEVADGMLIDHVNQNSMDNRRANLRAATRAQNIRNRKKFSNLSGSKYKGIYRDRNRKRWIAQIMLGKRKYILAASETKSTRPRPTTARQGSITASSPA